MDPLNATRFHGYTRAPVRVEAAATLYSLRNLFGRLAFVKFRTPQWQVCRRVCFDNFEKKLYISNVVDRNINKLFINVNEETRRRRRGENEFTKLTKRQNKLIKNESEVNRIFEKGGER